jgi:hypothetical protein
VHWESVCERILSLDQVLTAFTVTHSVKDYRLQTQKLSNERDEAITRATRGLESVQGARERRAKVSFMQARVDELKSGLAKLRKDNDKSMFCFSFVTLRMLC